MRKKSIYVLFIILIFFGCDYLRKKNTVQLNPVARVGEKYLYLTDLVAMLPAGLSRLDSSNFAEKYVDNWVKKQLMITKAEEELSINEVNIDQKVEDYRFDLIMHEFEKIYINSHLSTTVPVAEVKSYYEVRSDNFLLKQNIVRALFAKIPNTINDLNQIRRDLRNYPNSDLEGIKKYCYRFAEISFLEDSVWINFDELIANTPFINEQNKTQFLERTVFSETRDDKYIYLLRIVEYKISDQIAPLDYIQEDIESIIINKRKLTLKKDLQRIIYEEALKTKKFEIYRD